MKKLKLVSLISTLIILLIISSCQNAANDENYQYIAGSYIGSFTPENKSPFQGTVDVTAAKNNQIEIHCYSELLDTTFMMDAYEYGDSIILCATGTDFYNEYSQMRGASHTMDMHGDQSQWMHHLNDEHGEGDEHYGSFDMQNHTFNYVFRMMENNSYYKIRFNGVKQK